jgi:hypothetical protein
VRENCKIPLPIKFNCWKHHALFIKKELKSFKSEAQINQLQSTLLKIGESQMDLYHGFYSPEEIANQTIKHLASFSIKNSNEYKRWLYKNGKEYHTITLKDKSVWTLRSGDEEKRFVHIHPGRYSPHTVRVKALTLKTAICVLAFAKIKSVTEFDIDLINEARKICLNASPLKSVNKEAGLGKLITLLKYMNENNYV